MRLLLTSQYAMHYSGLLIIRVNHNITLAIFMCTEKALVSPMLMACNLLCKYVPWVRGKALHSPAPSGDQ